MEAKKSNGDSNWNSNSSNEQEPSPSMDITDEDHDMEDVDDDEDEELKDDGTSTPPQISYPIEDYTPPSSSSTHDLKHSFSWDTLLNEPEFCAASVSLFQHAPMSDCWDNIIVGMKVEVENRDCETFPGVFSSAFWVATVLRISGYNALLRYEGFGQDGSKDFWMNLCSDKVHPVGWCATKGRPLIPPKTIQTKYTDWKDFLVKRLTGARTLPSNFYCKVWESVGSIFRPGMKLEVVDKMRICQVRVATIQEITGRRLFLQYDDVDHNGGGFWCHEESPLIHPVGWAKRVGHQVVASQEYFDRCEMEAYIATDCTADMFPEYRQPPGTFQVGMKLEAVDPLNLATICVATVMKVLRFGYIVIGIDGYESDETGSDWFCYHASSALLFPPGFCDRNHITLKAPTGFENKFTWYDYLKATNSIAAPVSLFCQRDEIKHGFLAGMKIECADQMDPRLICVGTVTKVVGRLLKVHFDGWEIEYDQWMDCESVDMYPVGWAELVGHKLEGPRTAIAPAKKPSKKAAPKKGKKRTSNGATTTPGNRKQKQKLNVSDAEASSSKTPTPPPREATPTPPLKATPTPPPPPLKVIPRLVDSAGGAAIQRGKDSSLDPASWTVEEVTQFLEINECGNLVEAFTEQKIDGDRFLSLSKDEMMKLVSNKIGPCLKVENLLTLLKARMNPAQARFNATRQKAAS